jgi:NAD(P)-dependent dehydrogenase (short-subunit alcohol dehydrogenase family)
MMPDPECCDGGSDQAQTPADQAALVAGGGSGICGAVAELPARHCANLVAFRDDPSLRTTAVTKYARISLEKRGVNTTSRALGGLFVACSKWLARRPLFRIAKTSARAAASICSLCCDASLNMHLNGTR